jgi:hypothetical protein
MTDIDTLATEARRRAQGEIAMVEVPEAEEVMGERRRRHALRNGMAAVAIVAVLGVGVGAAVAANSGGTPKPDVAVAPVDDRATLEFRAVRSETECGRGARPPAGFEVMPDAKNEQCYVLGPPLMDGTSLADVEVAYNPNAAGYELQLKFANDDFVQKIGGPMTGKQVAIVVDDIVYSAPTINAGITGREVNVTGDFDEASAKTLAAALRGVPESEVAVPPTTPDETVPQRSQLRFMQGPNCGVNGCEGTTFEPQVADATAREDAGHGWVVAVELTDPAQFNDTDPIIGVIHGVPYETLRVDDDTLLMVPEANARAAAEALRNRVLRTDAAVK